ncbi:hypothetical protein Acr_10g0010360 [Actinidia rufa]|uniref:Uncharacterized protein n=1 Tax=Actinidia rufa TaxID=165716 RepID=A0A7J0FAH1_9ERIC|nr:hypothetical protein Acr_10g0010360 [Actinidia rufa]
MGNSTIATMDNYNQVCSSSHPKNQSRDKYLEGECKSHLEELATLLAKPQQSSCLTNHWCGGLANLMSKEEPSILVLRGDFLNPQVAAKVTPKVDTEIKNNIDCWLLASRFLPQ